MIRTMMMRCVRVRMRSGVGRAAAAAISAGTSRRATSDLYIHRTHFPSVLATSACARPYSTSSSSPSPLDPSPSPLETELLQMMRLRGPLTVHAFMNECLGNPRHGYYSSQRVFGADGDFVTSPEISELFGEILGIWCVSMWQRLGEPEKLQLVELGPGRGLLMRDLLRIARRFPKFERALSVHLVDSSLLLHQTQRRNIASVYSPGILEEDDSSKKGDTRQDEHEAPPARHVTVSDSEMASFPVKLKWHTSLADVPIQPSGGAPLLLLANEFLDALPVHQFEFTSRGWCERMVDTTGAGIIVDPDQNTDVDQAIDNLAHELQHTAPTVPVVDEPLPDEYDFPYGDESGLHFQFVRSKSPTQASRVFMSPARDPERRASNMQLAQRGNRIEVCPGAMATAQDVAKRIAVQGGAALFIDYGQDGALDGYTLQAVRRHKFTHPLHQPGLADLTTLVDFAAVRRAAQDAVQPGQIAVHGLVSQGMFLTVMGIKDRLAQLLQSPNLSDEQAERAFSACKRLVEDDQMGQHFQVMCIAGRDVGVPIGMED